MARAMGTDRRARRCALSFATAEKEFGPKIFRMSSIRSSLPKTTERDLGYRSCTESFRSTEDKSKSRANWTRTRRFTFRSRKCGLRVRWLRHDARAGLHHSYAG